MMTRKTDPDGAKVIYSFSMTIDDVDIIYYVMEKQKIRSLSAALRFILRDWQKRTTPVTQETR